jgi:hypothetical protein
MFRITSVSRCRLRPIALSLLILHLGGCTTWRPAPLEPRRQIDEERPPIVRVVRQSGRPLVIRNPRVARDSIATVSGPCRRQPGLELEPRYLCPTEGVVPLSDVSALELREPDHVGTLLLVVPLVSLLVLAGVMYDAWGDGFFTDPS